MAGSTAGSKDKPAGPAPQVGRTIIQLTAEDGAAIDRVIRHQQRAMVAAGGLPVRVSRTDIIRGLIAKHLDEVEAAAAVVQGVAGAVESAAE